MGHDFINWPELTNAEMQVYGFESPHKQITQDIRARVVKVVDGDTIHVRWTERDFAFPVRFLDINAPEMSEPRGKEVREWLEQQILDEEVDLIIDPDRRVGKWGRLLAHVFSRGMDMGTAMIMLGLATEFDKRNEGKIPEVETWF